MGLLSFPVVALCHGDPTALVLLGHAFIIFQKFFGGVNVGVSHLKPWVCVVAELVMPPALLHPHHQGQLFRFAHVSQLSCLW